MDNAEVEATAASEGGDRQKKRSMAAFLKDIHERQKKAIATLKHNFDIDDQEGSGHDSHGGHVGNPERRLDEDFGDAFDGDPTQLVEGLRRPRRIRRWVDFEQQMKTSWESFEAVEGWHSYEGLWSMADLDQREAGIRYGAMRYFLQRWQEQLYQFESAIISEAVRSLFKHFVDVHSRCTNDSVRAAGEQLRRRCLNGYKYAAYDEPGRPNLRHTICQLWTVESGELAGHSVAAVRLIPPPSLDLHMIKSDLQDREEIDLDEELRLGHSPVTAMITGLFHRLSSSNERYGYISTGEAYIFFRLSRTHLCDIEYYVLDQTQTAVDPYLPYTNAVACITSFLNHASISEPMSREDAAVLRDGPLWIEELPDEPQEHSEHSSESPSGESSDDSNPPGVAESQDAGSSRGEKRGRSPTPQGPGHGEEELNLQEPPLPSSSKRLRPDPEQETDLSTPQDPDQGS